MKAKPCIALLSLGITLAACQPTPSDTTSDIEVGQLDATSTLAPNENASIMVLDPATGEVATDPNVEVEGTAALQTLETTRTPASELETIISDDGTVTILLDDTYSSPLVATIDCHGNLRTQHVASSASELPGLPGNLSGEGCPDVATSKPSPEASGPSDLIPSIGDQGDAQ